MKILDGYLWRVLLIGILVTWVSLVLLDAFFALLPELSNAGKHAHYGALQAFWYIVYTLPGRFYEFFPTATLIGALMGLGQLAAHSEIIAMRAAGVSINGIMRSVLKLGAVMALLIFALGEWVVPKTELHAQSFKLEKQKSRIGLTESGIWAKKGNQFVRVKKVWSRDKFSNVSVFQIDPEKGVIEKIIKAKEAVKNGEKWILQTVTERTFSENDIQTSTSPELIMDELISSNILDAVTLETEHLSTRELSEYIRHQDENDLNTQRLEQAYWKRFSIPAATLVMLVLATPFAFGSQRNASAGQRLFIGILVGLSFYLINRTLSDLGVVYGVSPILSVTLPLLLFLLIGLMLLRRVEKI